MLINILRAIRSLFQSNPTEAHLEKQQKKETKANNQSESPKKRKRRKM